MTRIFLMFKLAVAATLGYLEKPLLRRSYGVRSLVWSCLLATSESRMASF